MSRPKNASPSYLLHRPSGRARVRLRVDGRFHDFYLGPYNSPESWEKYHRLLAEHFRQGEGAPESGPYPIESEPEEELCIAALVVKYDDFARQYYVKNGEATNDRFRAGVGALVNLYGSVAAWEFGPNRLRALREQIIVRGNANSAEFDENGNLVRAGDPLCRTYVNSLIRDLVRMFKWAVSHELIPLSVYQSLTKVEGIRKGKDSRVREPEPVKAVPDEHFWAVVNVVAPQIATMLQVQRLTGMRPDEVTIIRKCDIRMDEGLWSYRPNSHKLDWRDHEKEILLGPAAQNLLDPWLQDKDLLRYLFSPAEVAAESWARRRRRKPGRLQERKIARRIRTFRAHYSDATYRQAVQRACKRAKVPVWSPGQLRHNVGTEVRKRFGVEGAQLVLGHRKLSTTEIYAERNRALYGQIMKEIG